MIYNNDDPLDCGARLWIETDAEIELIDETTYSEIKNFLWLIKQLVYYIDYKQLTRDVNNAEQDYC